MRSFPYFLYGSHNSFLLRKKISIKNVLKTYLHFLYGYKKLTYQSKPYEQKKKRKIKMLVNVSNKIRKKNEVSKLISKLTWYPSSTKEAGRYLQKRIKKR